MRGKNQGKSKRLVALAQPTPSCELVRNIGLLGKSTGTWSDAMAIRNKMLAMVASCALFVSLCAHSAHQPAPFLVDWQNRVNTVVVMLDFADPALDALLPNLPTPLPQPTGEQAVLDAVNAHDPVAADFFQDPSAARYLLTDDRRSPEERALLSPDDPLERLHRYLVLTYPSVEAAVLAASSVAVHLGVVFAGVDSYMGFPEDPPLPQAYQTFSRHLYQSIPCSTGDALSVQVDLATRTITVDFPVSDQQPCPDATTQFMTIGGVPGGQYRVSVRSRGTNGVREESVQDLIVATVPSPQQVHAFYNDTIKHYFITAGAAEHAALLAGGGGGGWQIVDAGFKAWPADSPAPEAAQPVCRFYSTVVNSHFYTAGPGECELLKRPDSGWVYEGIAFRALVPTKGSCPAGTMPVWRLYNNRFAESDSNHRFVVSADTYRHMIANGWIGEGVAFCSPEF